MIINPNEELLDAQEQIDDLEAEVEVLKAEIEAGDSASDEDYWFYDESCG